MTSRFPILLTFIASGLLSLQAEDAFPLKDQNGKPISCSEDSSKIKWVKGFGGVLLLSSDLKVFETWDTKPEIPVITTIDKVSRNGTLLPVVVFISPGITASGEADVTCELTIRKPDGTIYGETMNLTGWKGRYLAPPANLMLTKDRIGLHIEPADPLGTYTIDVTLRDKVRQVELPLHATFRVDE